MVTRSVGYAFARVAALLIPVLSFMCSHVGATVPANNVVAQWKFDSTNPVSSGPFVADTGTGSAIGFHAGASVYSGSVGNGSSKSFSSNAWAAGDYYQFQTSTTGLADIGIQFDQVSSTTGPRDFKIQYSTNGSTFIEFANYSVQPNANPAWQSATPVAPAGLDTYNFDFRSIAALNNAANVYFRITAASPLIAAQDGNTFANIGVNRVDNVSIYSAYDPTMAPIPQPPPLPVLPEAGDIVIGLGSGRQKVTLELVRGEVPSPASKPATYSPWTAQNFIRFVKFDNLGGTAHNVHGNLLGVDPGSSASFGGRIYS